jgi:hypothetical protein
MPGGFGTINSVLSPILERVVKEERLGSDHPRKGRDGKSERHRQGHLPEGSRSEAPEDATASISSTHIDLRI